MNCYGAIMPSASHNEVNDAVRIDVCSGAEDDIGENCGAATQAPTQAHQHPVTFEKLFRIQSVDPFSAVQSGDE
jgi:hypothetical protein